MEPSLPQTKMIFYDLKNKKEVILTTDEGELISPYYIRAKKSAIRVEKYQILKKDGRFLLRSKGDYHSSYYPSKNKSENFGEYKKLLIGTETLIVDDGDHFTMYSQSIDASFDKNESFSS